MNDHQTKEHLLEALSSAVHHDASPRGPVPPALPDNLLDVVDSFGFVQLVMEMEQRLGIELDLERVDLDTLVEPTLLVSFLQSQVDTAKASTR